MTTVTRTAPRNSVQPAFEPEPQPQPAPERSTERDTFERGDASTRAIAPPARLPTSGSPIDVDPLRIASALPADLPPGRMLEEPWPATASAAHTDAPVGEDPCNVEDLSFGEKVGRVLESAAEHLGPEALETLKESLPSALLGMAAFAGAHAIGIGFIADVAGAAFLGAEAGRLVGEAINLARDFQDAKCHSDLDAVGQKLARLASEGGFDLLLGALGKKLGKRGGTDTETNRLRQGGDPMRTKYGPARESHPEEWEAALQRLRDAGAEVVFRPGEMAYGPSAAPGKPGRVILDPDASIGALRHEMQHFADDEALGFPGLRAMLENPNVQWQLELNAYEREIAFARENGDEELVRELQRLMEQERRHIFGEEER